MLLTPQQLPDQRSRRWRREYGRYPQGNPGVGKQSHLSQKAKESCEKLEAQVLDGEALPLVL